jgi:hypothetical protein
VNRTAVVLPGRRYGHAQAGLRLTELALEQAGFELVRVEWPAEGMPEEPEATAAAVAGIVVPLLDPAPAYVVAKSLGTLAAPLAAERDIAGIWLTPLLREALCRDGILRNRAPQLLAGGSEDFAWDTGVAARAAETGATVVELPRADHGFEVPGDAVASAETLVGLTRAVLEFVG